jgi:hypothetical protein
MSTCAMFSGIEGKSRLCDDEEPRAYPLFMPIVFTASLSLVDGWLPPGPPLSSASSSSLGLSQSATSSEAIAPGQLGSSVIRAEGRGSPSATESSRVVPGGRDLCRPGHKRRGKILSRNPSSAPTETPARPVIYAPFRFFLHQICLGASWLDASRTRRSPTNAIISALSHAPDRPILINKERRHGEISRRNAAISRKCGIMLGRGQRERERERERVGVSERGEWSQRHGKQRARR